MCRPPPPNENPVLKLYSQIQRFIAAHHLFLLFLNVINSILRKINEQVIHVISYSFWLRMCPLWIAQCGRKSHGSW